MKKVVLVVTCLLFFVSQTFAVDFSKYDVNDINAVRDATKAYQKEFKNKKGSKEAEQNYYEFLEFYQAFEEIQCKKIYLPYNSNIKSQLRKYTKQYYKYGLVAQFDEGDFFLSSSHKYKYKNFAKYLSKPTQELLDFNKSDERIIYDCKYIIPKTELQKYADFYKNFIKKYPKYSKEHNIYGIYEQYKKYIEHYPEILF